MPSLISAEHNLVSQPTLPAQKEKINWELLAITRFFLACVVMATHLIPHDDTGFLNWLSYFGGFEAVLGFLLISGFSIGKSISRNRENYFKRRVSRIYPVYLAALATSIFVMRPPFDVTNTLDLGLNLFFLLQVFTINPIALPSWTLALEVWMYALAPLLLKASFKQLNIFIYASFMAFIVYTCGRMLFHWPYFHGTILGVNLILLSFGWILGFAIAVFPDRVRINRFNLTFIYATHIFITAAMATAYSFKHHQLQNFFWENGLQLLFQSTCLVWVYVVILYNQQFKVFKGWVARLFNLLGNISYPLYLVHLVVFLYLDRRGYRFGPVMVLGALFYSWLIYQLFDFYSKKRREVEVVPVVN